MTVWVLILVSLSNPRSIYVNSFDSQAKCEERIKKMADIYYMECVKTTVNK